MEADEGPTETAVVTTGKVEPKDTETKNTNNKTQTKFFINHFLSCIFSFQISE